MASVERLLQGKIPGPETGIEVKKSVCTICDPMTQCGLDLSVKDGRIIKVEGTKENPHSAGTLCSPASISLKPAARRTCHRASANSAMARSISDGLDVAGSFSAGSPSTV